MPRQLGPSCLGIWVPPGGGGGGGGGTPDPYACDTGIKLNMNNGGHHLIAILKQ